MNNNTFIFPTLKFKPHQLTEKIINAVKDGEEFKHGSLTIQNVRTKNPSAELVNKMRLRESRSEYNGKKINEIEIYYKDILIFSGFSYLQYKFVESWFMYSTYLENHYFGKWLHYGDWINDVEKIVESLELSKRVARRLQLVREYEARKQMDDLNIKTRSTILANYHEL